MEETRKSRGNQISVKVFLKKTLEMIDDILKRRLDIEVDELEIDSEESEDEALFQVNLKWEKGEEKAETKETKETKEEIKKEEKSEGKPEEK